MIRDMTAAILSVSETLNRVSEEVNETYDANGYPIRDVVESSVSFRGSLQPLSGTDLESLPVGYVIKDKFKLYVPVSEIILQKKDIITTSDNRRLIVVDSEDWESTGNFMKYILELVVIGTR